MRTNAALTQGVSSRFRVVRALVIFMAGACAATGALGAEPPGLASVTIEGSTVLSPASLFASYRSRIGEPMSRKLAWVIAAGVAGLYREAGYARPELRLDETLAADGVMRLRVFEPRISRVVVEGDPGRYGADIERIAARVADEVPLRRDSIANALADMRRWPGLEIAATTRPDGAARNVHELVLQADFAPVSGLARLSNRGTEEIGPLFLVSQLEGNDLAGWGEALGLVVAATGDPGEYLSGALYLDRPLGAAGARGTVMVFRSRSQPHERPVEVDDEYVRERLTLRVARPLGSGMTLTGAFEADDLAIDRAGRKYRDDRLRVVEAGLRTNSRASGATQLSSLVELRTGLDALGAGLHADDLAIDRRRHDFLLTQAQMTSLTRFADAWSLRVDAFAQYAGQVLPDNERFKIGGERLGRGFEVAEIAGDHGLGAKALVRRDLPAAELPLGRPSLYGFYDLGAAWKKDLPGRESAATLGAGAALNGERLSAYVEIAKPLTHGDVEGKKSASLFAELSLRF
jgi:hemolysin activation/secretion protein